MLTVEHIVDPVPAAYLYRIDLPDCVNAAIDNYRADNDWINQFLESCCDVGAAYRQASGALYEHYRQHCAKSGDYTRSAADFKRAMQDSGFECHKTKSGAIYYGLTLKPPEYAAQPLTATAQDSEPPEAEEEEPQTMGTSYSRAWVATEAEQPEL